MTNPVITARIAFGSNAFASSPSWTDVSSDIMSFSIRRGRNYSLGRMDSGTASVTLLNTSGNYWPYNASGDYYGDILPVTRLNIRASYPVASSTKQDNNDGAVYGYQWAGWYDSYPDYEEDAAQLFTPSVNYVANSVKVYIKKSSSWYGVYPTTLFAAIKTIGGTVLCSGSIAISTVTTDYAWHEITFASPAPLVSGTQYFLVLYTSQDVAADGDLKWATTTDAYAGGDSWYYTDSTEEWTEVAGEDQIFEIWGSLYTTYDLYTGFIESWRPDWIHSNTIIGSTMTLSCADLQKCLSRFLLNNAGYSAELSGARVGHVLDSLGWPAAARTIATGQSTLQATGALVNASAMNHLYSVLDSELGIFFIAGDGKATFQDRLTRSSLTSSATFTDDGTDYFQPKISYDDKFIYNDCRGARSGGTEQVFTDATSIAAYGQRTLSASGLLNSTDDDVQDRSYFQLANYKQPKLRVESLLIKPGADPDTLYPYVLGYELGTRITVELDQATIDEDYVIEGINLDWKANQPQAMTCTWQLSNYSNISFPVRHEEILYTAGAGSLTNLIPSSGTNWSCTHTKSDSNYVNTPGHADMDYYTVDNLASVGDVFAIYVGWAARAASPGIGYATPYLKIGGGTYLGTSTAIGSTYLDGGYLFEGFLGTLTLAEINAMEIGILLDPGTALYGCQCDFMYAIVYHYS